MTIAPTTTTISTQIFQATSTNDASKLKSLLLDNNNNCHLFTTNEKGLWPLHVASSKGYLEIVKILLEFGHPWNCQKTLPDSDDDTNVIGITAGELAKQNNHNEVYQYLVEEGVRAELIFGILENHNNDKHDDDDDENISDNDNKEKKDTRRKQQSNAEYLSKPLKFSTDKTRILDFQNNAVMMSWETPLMIQHALYLSPISGLHILNVGFGLGIIDTEFQKSNPASHTIIEAHPDVYKKMIDDGWDKRKNVKIVFGRWQDVIESLDRTFDAIFFDTFGEFYRDLKEFHEHLLNLLSNGGTYSFFNGLGGHNIFFHDVYCRVAELDLNEMGINVEYIPIQFTPPSKEEWSCVNRPYWCLGQYNLPICRMMDLDVI